MGRSESKVMGGPDCVNSVPSTLPPYRRDATLRGTIQAPSPDTRMNCAFTSSAP